jgi:hypothetical protein
VSRARRRRGQATLPLRVYCDMRTAKAIASLLAALPIACGAAGFNVLLDQLEADHAALLAAEQDFRQLRAAGELSATAAADYSSYLQALRGRVANDCQALVEAGGVLPAGAPCAAFPVNMAAPRPLDQGVPLNRAERTGELDAELEAGLSQFDELLLREQERVRASAPRSGDGAAAGGDGGSDSGATLSAGDGGLAGAPGSAAASAGREVQQGETGDGRPPGAGEGGEGAVGRGAMPPPPPGTPDGSDDDVVARQLREAAEQETDPELRGKLWEEYRRYKQGIR